MYISRKTQLILTNVQKQLIDEMIYIRRNAWNKLIEIYNPIIMNKLENKIKSVLPSQTELEQFLKKYYICNSRILRSCVQDYLESWKMCFKIPKRRKPHYHSCQHSELSVPMYDCSTKIKYVKKYKNNVFSLSATKGVKAEDKIIRFSEDMSEFLNVDVPVYSISRRNGKYYISLTFKIDDYEKIQSKSNQVGCDWGLKEFLTCSNEAVYNLPKSLIRQEIRIKNLQRKLSKKSKGSKNRKIVKNKLNAAWLRYTNIRKDFIEKLSYKLLSENNLICLEDLDIQEMINNTHKNRRFNIYKNCFNTFKIRLIQKSERFTGEIVFVDKYFPSSQLCSSCGERYNEMKDLRRIFKCDCGLEIDRDLNASINILNEGLRTKLVG